jgi:hypothetical protein
MSEIDPTIHEQIGRVAEYLPVPPGSAEAVMARGRRRRGRQRATATLCASALIAAGATGLVLHRPSPTRTGVVDTAPLASAPAAASTPLATQLVWRAEPLTAGLYLESSLSPSPTRGPVYAVSTAPGVLTTGEPVNELYRSPAGAEWSELTKPSGLSADGVATNGTDVYDIGTGPAVAATGSTDVVGVARSANKGATWTESVLPQAYVAPKGALTVIPEAVQVASAPQGEMAMVQANATLNLAAILPSGAPTAHKWAPTATGAALLGSENPHACPAGEVVTVYPNGSAKILQLGAIFCANSSGTPVSLVAPAQAFHQVGFYSWTQLGVSAQAASALQEQPVAFFSADGTTYHQVPLPSALALGYDYVLTGGPAGFDLSIGGFGQSDPTQVLQSLDGRSWEYLPSLPADTTVMAQGILAGALSVVLELTQGGSSGFAADVYSLEGGQWKLVKVIGTKLTTVSASFGPLGLAVLAGVENNRGNAVDLQIHYTSNGSAWQTEDVSTVVPVPTSFESASIVVSANSVVATLTDQPTSDPTTGPAKQIALIGQPAS